MPRIRVFEDDDYSMIHINRVADDCVDYDDTINLTDAEYDMVVNAYTVFNAAQRFIMDRQADTIMSRDATFDEDDEEYNPPHQGKSVAMLKFADVVEIHRAKMDLTDYRGIPVIYDEDDDGIECEVKHE